MRENSSLTTTATTTTTTRVLTLSTISALSVLKGCGGTARHRQWQAQHSTDLSPLSAVHVKLRLQGFAGERRQLQELFMEKGHVVLVQNTWHAQQLFVLSNYNMKATWFWYKTHGMSNNRLRCLIIRRIRMKGL